MSRQPMPPVPNARELERLVKESLGSAGFAQDIPRRCEGIRLRGKPTDAEREAQRAHDKAPLVALGAGGYRRRPVRYE